MSSSAYQFLEESLPRRLDKEVRTSCYGIYTMLAFGAVVGKEVVNYVERRAGVLLGQKAIYESMHENGELLHDVKPFALMLLASQIDKYASTVPPGALATSLSRKTQNNVARALAYVPLRRCLTSHLKAGRQPETSKEMDERIEEAMSTKDFRTYVRKFIYHKMKFIMDAGTRFDEIESELRQHAYYNLLRTYPAWNDPGHMIALAKIGAHNRGHNYIKEQTTKSRAHLHTNSNGECSAVNVSWDLIKDGIDSSTRSAYSLSCSLSGSVVSQDDFDSSFSLNQLLNSNHLTSLQRRYLRLVSGQFDSDFSAYLGCESNSIDASECDFSTYDTKVRKYLQISQPAATAFLSSLRVLL